MKISILMITFLFYSLPAFCNDIQLNQIDNQYFSILLFPNWSLEYVGGKENQRMYSIISNEDRKTIVSIFYDYKGLNPNKYLSNKYLYSYSANGLTFYRHNNYTYIVKGNKKSFLSIKLEDTLDRELITKLISIFASIEIK